MKAIVGVQARMSSSRLPGKALADLAGVPMLQRVVDRARAAHLVEEVVVLTSTEDSDDVLEDYCEENDIPCRRGPLDDVYARYKKLVLEYDPKYVVRVTGDCPLIDPAHIDRQIDAMDRESADFAPVPAGEHLYPGQGVMTARALLQAAQSLDPRDREHVGSFHFQRHSDSFVRVELDVDAELAHYGRNARLCVDEPADLQLMRRVFEEFAPRHGSLVPLLEVVRWMALEGAGNLNAQVADSADNQALLHLREARS